jgi:hypothetical protein
MPLLDAVAFSLFMSGCIAHGPCIPFLRWTIAPTLRGNFSCLMSEPSQTRHIGEQAETIGV